MSAVCRLGKVLGTSRPRKDCVVQVQTTNASPATTVGLAVDRTCQLNKVLLVRLLNGVYFRLLCPLFRTVLLRTCDLNSCLSGSKPIPL